MAKAPRKARTHKVWPASPATVSEQAAQSPEAEVQTLEQAYHRAPVTEQVALNILAPEKVARFAEKKKRVPVGLRNPMSVNDDLDPNFEYRFVRAKNGRIQQFIEGGYELVPGKVDIGDPNIAHASGMGSATSIPSGDSEDRVYLMRIPNALYKEDQAAKQAKVDEIEEHLKRKPKTEGLEGDIKINR